MLKKGCKAGLNFEVFQGKEGLHPPLRGYKVQK